MDSFEAYMKSIRKYPTYGHARSVQHINLIKDEYNALIHGNLKLVAKIASEYANLWPKFDVMDFIQEGNMALMRCADFYKEDRGSFVTYLGQAVRISIMQFIKSNTGDLSLFKTKGQREVFNNLSKVLQKYQNEGVSLQDLSKEYGCTTQDLELIMGTYNPGAIEDVLIDSPESEYILDESVKLIRIKIQQFRKTLSKRQLVVFDDTMYTGTKSLEEVAKEIGISRQGVWDIKSRVLRKATEFFDLDDLKRISVGEVWRN